MQYLVLHLQTHALHMYYISFNCIAPRPLLHALFIAHSVHWCVVQCTVYVHNVLFKTRLHFRWAQCTVSCNTV